MPPQRFDWGFGAGLWDVGAHELGAPSADLDDFLPDVGEGSGTTYYYQPGASGNGLAVGTPGSWATVKALVGPGDVIEVIDGTYDVIGNVVDFRGADGAYITIRPQTPGGVVFNYGGTGPGQSEPFLSNAGTSFSDAPAYVQFRDLIFDGRVSGSGAQAMGHAIRFQKYAHHIRLRENTVRYTGAAGLGFRSCDYCEVVGNQIYRCGDPDGNGWSSGINFHYGDGNPQFDAYDGFHHVVAWNLVSGGYDPFGAAGRNGGTGVPTSTHTDGAGYICDCPGSSRLTLPKTLIVGNVVWQCGNGGINVNRGTDQWVVGNTIVACALDPLMGNTKGAVIFVSTLDSWAINNVCWMPSGQYPIKQAGDSLGLTTDVDYVGNVWFGGAWTGSGVPSAWQSDASKFVNADPVLVGPSLDFSDDAQLSAVAPWDIGNRLKLAAGSPCFDAGVDPRDFMNANETADFERYGLVGAYGLRRPF